MARFEDEIYKITEKELILNYKRYEYTNNMVYEFFERTLKNKKDIKDFQYISPMEHTLKIKDVILFENDGLYIVFVFAFVFIAICFDVIWEFVITKVAYL